MFESAQLHLAAGASRAALEQALAALPGRGFVNLPGCHGGGDYSWDSAPGAGRALCAQLAALPAIARVDAVRYRLLGGGLRQPALRDGIKRSLFFRVLPGVAADAVSRIEEELLLMPAYLRGIRNWSLGRVEPGSGWTHIWQQEYARLDDLLGEYMLHPYHWARVDRWFDPESPEHSVDVRLSHAFCAIDSSVLAALPLAGAGL